MFYSQDGWKVVYTRISCPRLILLFSVFLVHLIFLLCSPVSILRSLLMLEDNAFPFQGEGQVKIIDIFICVYSRQNFSSSQLL